jgi:hypothetical protein
MPVPLTLAVRRLAELLNRENAALAALDFRRATALLPEKTAAISDLTASHVAAGTLPSGHADLDLIGRSLAGLASENRRLLERAIVVQQRVIGIVARAAATAANEPAYGAHGRKARISRPMAFSARA